MRILPIIPNLYLQRRNIEDNNYSRYNLLRPPVADTFTGNLIKPIKAKSEFREHALKRIYNCMYCGIPMRYDETKFLEWKRSNLFSKPIGEFVKTFKKYRDSLHDTEQKIFDYVEFISYKSPEAKLNTVIKMMSVQANRELLKLQTPIFDSMAVESCKLSKENQKAVLDLISKSKLRILRIPHLEKFSGKEMRYKIENLSKTIPNDKTAKRINNLAELLTIPAIYKETEPLTDKIVIRILRTITPNARINKNTKIKNKYSAKRLNMMIIDAIKTEAQVLKRKDIYNLCLDAEKMLKEEPVTGKFTNKSFMHDLRLAMESVDEKDLTKRNIFQLANSLPTSSSSVYAFITKHEQSAPEKIAYDLFTPSELTLEHQKPSSLKGPDILSNWAWACKRCNNTRSNKDMRIFYKQFDPNNAQKYYNEIIADANKGYFDFKDVVGMLKIFKDQSGRKLKSKHLKFRPPYSE